MPPGLTSVKDTALPILTSNNPARLGDGASQCDGKRESEGTGNDGSKGGEVKFPVIHQQHVDLPPQLQLPSGEGANIFPVLSSSSNLISTTMTQELIKNLLGEGEIKWVS